MLISSATRTTTYCEIIKKFDINLTFNAIRRVFYEARVEAFKNVVLISWWILFKLKPTAKHLLVLR